MPLEAVVISLDENVTLDCTLSMSASYSWTRGGKSISHSTAMLTVEYRDSASPVMAGGDYVCTAMIGSNTVTNNFYVGLAPYIITVPSDQQTMINDTVTFNCDAVGFPTPNITWKRVPDTLMLPGTISDEIPSHIIMSTLNISSVAGTDYGDYECIASISDFTSVNVDVSDLNATDDTAIAALSGRASIYHVIYLYLYL